MFVEDVSCVFGGVCLVHNHWEFFWLGCIRYVVDFVHGFIQTSIMDGKYVDQWIQLELIPAINFLRLLRLT
jgi:hypothetical protein